MQARQASAPEHKPLSAGIQQAGEEEDVKRGTRTPGLEWLEAENDEGNIEYKLRLKDPTTMRFQQLVMPLVLLTYSCSYTPTFPHPDPLTNP